MKTSRFSDSQVLAILKQAENGDPVTELCREHGRVAPHFIHGEQSLAAWTPAYGTDEKAGKGKCPP